MLGLLMRAGIDGLARLRQGLLIVAALAALAACSTAGRDLATASDETKDAKRAGIKLELATAYFQRGQLEVALDNVKQAIAMDSRLAPAFNMRGLIYGAMGEDTLAEDSFKRALELDDHDGSSLHNYGWFLCQHGRYPDAQGMFSRVLALPHYPDGLQTLLARGVCYGKAGQYDQAEKALTTAYEAAPGNPEIASSLADVLYRRGEYERARFYIRRVNNAPDRVSAGSLWLALRIERRMGNRRGATDLASQLHARFPHSREAELLDRGAFDD